MPLGMSSYAGLCISEIAVFLRHTSPVQHLQLSYAFSPSADTRATGRISNPDITLLAAVRNQGSISAAARALGLSYRHAWGALKRWEQTLGQEVLVWDRGQAAKLSEFGLKLLYAEQLAQARLAPQIEALHAELTRSFAMAFNPQAQVLQMHASHDEALGLLQRHCAAQNLHLDTSFTGSVDAIRALNEGRCTLAGFHTLLPSPQGSAAQQTYQSLLTPGLHKLIGFATRTQGLIVAAGNPLGIKGLADVAALGASFVNRALGTGTRVLIEALLDQAGLKSCGANRAL
jgi:putative molybdopterin biosynthesis protein